MEKGNAASPIANAPQAPAVPDILPLTSPDESPSRLATLPEELLGNIAIKLPSDDLAALRLTCRHIEDKTLHEWATEYFSGKCFMFSTESLGVLNAIASSEKLREYLHDVYIITASFCESSLDCCRGRRCVWIPTVHQREALLAYVRNQQNLRESGGDKQLLVNAFKKLPELHKLSLIDNARSLPSEVHGVYGMNKFRRTTSSNPTFPVTDAQTLEYLPWLSHVWKTMILALADSGNTAVATLEAIPVTSQAMIGYGLSPMDLRFQQDTMNKLAGVFSNLETLNVTLRTRSLRMGRQDSGDDIPRAVKSCKAFAQTVNSANRLHLTFDHGDWTKALCGAFLGTQDLSKITSLSLFSVCIDMATLASALCKLVSAEFVELSYVELTDDPAEGAWSPILQVLANLPKLIHLHLTYLKQAGRKVYFLEQPDDVQDEDPLSLDDLLGGADGDADDESWTNEDVSDDDELPELIPPSGSGFADSVPSATEDDATSALAPQEQQSAWAGEPQQPDEASEESIPARPRKMCREKTGKDYKAPGLEESKERGYYICLEGEEIQNELPGFIKECNISSGHSINNLAFDDLLDSIIGQAGAAVGAGAMFGPFAMPAQQAPPTNASHADNNNAAQEAPAAIPVVPPPSNEPGSAYTCTSPSPSSDFLGAEGNQSAPVPPPQPAAGVVHGQDIDAATTTLLPTPTYASSTATTIESAVDTGDLPPDTDDFMLKASDAEQGETNDHD